MVYSSQSKEPMQQERTGKIGLSAAPFLPFSISQRGLVAVHLILSYRHCFRGRRHINGLSWQPRKKSEALLCVQELPNPSGRLSVVPKSNAPLSSPFSLERRRVVYIPL